MFKQTLILIALAIFVSGCTVSKEKKMVPEKESVVKKAPRKVAPKKAAQKNNGIKLCKNIKGLKKGMTLEEVHNQLGLGKNKKHAFTKPFFYIKCYEADTMISYAEFKFYFDEGCTFRKVYKPSEKEVEENICSGRAGKFRPPEIFRY